MRCVIFQASTDLPSSWCPSSDFRHSDASLYLDSLNQEASSVTNSTRVEFVIGPTTKNLFANLEIPWRQYWDSIDPGIAASYMTDDYASRQGEALAECDSLECGELSSDS